MAESKRILLVDDSDVVTTVLATALEKEGFAVEVAHNGETAYELGLESSFDLAILDQLMPGLLGLEVLQGWREHDVDIPVLILSAVDDDQTAIQSLELGAFDFVRKPFRIPELVARIRQRLAD